MKALLDIIQQHKSGKAKGVYSVCSSHPLVIEASLLHALSADETVVIEATSNQVNQDGGYTGMQPVDFRDLVHTIAERVGLSQDKIILGGDHLGPNCWQHLTSAEAMDKSDILIAAYIEAGFRKIHLDCSMSCADDPAPLGDEIVAQRAARLCLVAEQGWEKNGGEPPVYIVGTEVPVPGGAQEDLAELELTSVAAATKTIDIHQRAFNENGLADVWQRVIGLVVQPGVEFDNHKVIDYLPEKATDLSAFSETLDGMVFEAHSTDYQVSENLKALVNDHFAILKVGPGLTFAMREACWALSAIEDQWIPTKQCSSLKQTILDAMGNNPEFWQKYYSAEEHQQLLDCQYSLSDRIRYYWPVAEVEAAFDKLLKNLSDNPPPTTLVSQHMPVQYEAFRSGEISLDPRQLIFHKISEVLKLYSAACHQYKHAQ